ncbi:DNA repair protein RecO [Aestuariicella sp. G3-2]|uniref:DNA repair protein RecO n=1 Tax=Pseudomaricurvus albidus TaxID=2842452 RepID=UPI001C0C856B|nr:DNA repair protein RecO [Aestuariicella albida]MBU3069920.1 DNA repair protein RecO [Aestuariicella albida]
MRVELQPGYILHSRPFRDTSLILDCLTEDYGRLSLIAKGARSAKSRQRQLCQPFTPLLLSWQGKSSLKTLTSIESRQLPLGLKGEFLFSGLYLNELLTRLVPEQDSCPEIYQSYEVALGQLADMLPLEPVLRAFELRMLEDLGYHLDLSRDADGLDLRAEEMYQWWPEQGWRLASDTLTAQSFPGVHLQAMREGDFQDPQTQRSAKVLTRILFKPLLGERPLQSRKLFQKTR